MAQTGNFPVALNFLMQNNNSWIVDSGATDHMPGNTSLLDEYTPSAANLLVAIADGSMTKVTRAGSVYLLKLFYISQLQFAVH